MIVNLEEQLFKASLTVSYPSGSCTVSLGGISYSHSGGGSHSFTLRKAGTWTVTATDGDKSDSASVIISQRGQAESLSLSYGIVLFDGGDNTALTGGWGSVEWAGLSSFTVNNKLSIICAGGGKSVTYAAFIHSRNKLDVTKLSRIELSISTLSQNIQNNVIEWDIGLVSTLPSGSDLVNLYQPLSFAKSIQPSAAGNYSIDVSALSGSYYLAYYTVFVGASNGFADKGGTITTTKITGV